MHGIKVLFDFLLDKELGRGDKSVLMVTLITSKVLPPNNYGYFCGAKVNGVRFASGHEIFIQVFSANAPNPLVNR